MKIIIELDGPIIDVEPVYWAAYSQVVSELGLARKDRAQYWPLVRRGAGIGELVSGALPRHLEHYRQKFPLVLESDEALTEGVPQAGVKEELRALGLSHGLSLVTLGKNAEARQRVLDAHDLSIHFSRMARLSADVFQRRDQLKQLAEDAPRVLIAAASEPLVKLANELERVVVGVAAGACAARRLTQAGAPLTFETIGALVDEIASGGHNLLKAGLLPPPQPVFDERRERRDIEDRRGRFGERRYAGGDRRGRYDRRR
jgi:phosphoglycolate phosphatase-like HAD superfamily hydrolase